MKIPSKVHVGPHTYAVSYVFPLVDGTQLMWGLTKHVEQTIEISDTLQPEHKVSTFIHELVHIISDQIGCVLSEDQVEAFGNLLADTLVRNDMVK